MPFDTRKKRLIKCWQDNRTPENKGGSNKAANELKSVMLELKNKEI